MEKDDLILEKHAEKQPYLFISYSHQDQDSMLLVKRKLLENHIRFWYDLGLNSGDDWNLVIAKRLLASSACLLLLSRNSAASEYVKNELNFAKNHKIPMFTLLLEDFSIPIDVELMISRIEYENDIEKLIHSLPAELSSDTEKQPAEQEQHPLYKISENIGSYLGTTFRLAHHNILKYKCLSLSDNIKEYNIKEALDTSGVVARMNHPAILQIYDVSLFDNCLITYQEYREFTLLDKYLETHKISEERIVRWLGELLDAVAYLYRNNYGLTDFVRNNLIVSTEDQIYLFRLNNPYYGIFKLKLENRNYYFEKELQEIAIFLSLLCTGQLPVLPLQMIRKEPFSASFMKKVNLIIQKCSKVDYQINYSDFDEIKSDLAAKHLTLKEEKFLLTRAKRLEKYADALSKREKALSFTSDGGVESAPERAALSASAQSLERAYGFEETILLKDQDFMEDQAFTGKNASITLLICTTGQIYTSSNTEILLGRDSSCCELTFTQPNISKLHAKIVKLQENDYLVYDMNSGNGTFVDSKMVRETPLHAHTGSIIRLGNFDLKIL